MQELSGLRAQIGQITSEADVAARKKALVEAATLLLFFPPPDYTPPRAAGQGFVPSSPLEEASLCLLLATEGKPEYLRKDRTLAWHLLFALSRARQFIYLGFAMYSVGVWEHSHRLEWRAWFEAFLAGNCAVRARLPLEMMTNMEKDKDPLTLVLLAKASLETGSVEQLKSKAIHDAGDWDRLKESIGHARKALDLTRGSGSALESRCMLTLGVALVAASRPELSGEDERALQQEEALALLQQAVDFDPMDAKALYNLALIQAEAKALDEALANVKAALSLDSGIASHCWALLANLLTAKQLPEEAIAAVDAALPEAGPEVEGLLLKIKARAQLQTKALDQALDTAALALRRFQKANAGVDGAVDAEKFLAVCHTEADCWLELARCFLAKRQLDDARYCVRQAKNLHHLSPAAHHLDARINMEDGKMEEAMNGFRDAVAICPYYAKSNIQLGKMYYRQKGESLHLARMVLRGAIRDEPWRAGAWQLLGRVHAKFGQKEEADNCARTAAGLALCMPAVSFNKLARPL